ncbi:MAG TPA: hypothetical protein PLS49_00880 [Candidatus Woesebacteria bacterium]|nr:hypothetical protein [Candidatus Woesebacteria bacterium]
MKKNKIILLVILFVSIFTTGLYIGLHLHGTLSLWIYEGKIKIDKFSCFGHTNWWETYQLDCYTKKPKTMTSFKFSNNLSCKGLLSSGLNEDNYSETTKQFLSLMTFKTDSINYTIAIDPMAKTLTRSNTGGEVAKGVFHIINEDNKIVTALRKAPLGEPFNSTDYEQITLFKNSGKGIIQGYITTDQLKFSESIRTSYILCE